MTATEQKAPTRQRVSQWLNDLSSHGIYDAPGLIKDFEECTGETAPKLTVHTTEATRRAIAARGLGGSLTAEADGGQVYGWEVAEDMAHHFANGFSPTAMGRGFRWSQAIQALEAAGH